jgi:hypothetical protein
MYIFKTPEWIKEYVSLYKPFKFFHQLTSFVIRLRDSGILLQTLYIFLPFNEYY